MKLDREKLLRWARIAAAICRYTGVVVLTFTLTASLTEEGEFRAQVVLPLQSVAGPNWVDDISMVAESTRSAMRHMSREDIVSGLNEGREEDGDLMAWRDELRIVDAYARQLEESVIRGTTIRPISEGQEMDVSVPDPEYRNSNSCSPFDHFYGVGSANSSPQQVEAPSGKSREDLNNEALRAWNATMKDRNYAVLAIPSTASHYPYGDTVMSLVWTGSRSSLSRNRERR
ncbi:MAG: hypothetical protein KF712_21170 [Akkermansiaceae bacterium]|nr:hypothetical protein [Akkermansiaceae bacterium]